MKTRIHDPLLVSVRKQLDAIKVDRTRSILIGVSGGIDSMVLADVLYQLGCSMAVAHVNFQLRGDDSMLDAMLVEDWCAEKHIPFFKKEMDTKKYASDEGINIQTAARNIRYTWWEELKDSGKFDFVATAHHRDDAIETSLMNMVRGTGIKGLKGIDATRSFFIRPLIAIPKIEVIRYANEHNIPYREDSSNESDVYQRNRIRHHLVPLLRELSEEGGLHHTFSRLGVEWQSWKHAYNEWKTKSISETSEGTTVKYDRGQEAFALAWLEENGLPWLLSKDYLEGDDKGKPLAYKDMQLLKKESELFLRTMNPFEEIVISGPGVHPVGNDLLTIEFLRERPEKFDDDAHTVYIDPNVVHWPLRVRQVVPGDIFKPFGMEGQHKKLQDFLTDQKLNVFEKSNVKLLMSGDNVLWVIGMRLDERSRVSGSAKEVYRLRYQKKVS